MAITTAAEVRIRELAEQHGVTAERTATDEWADEVTRLSGDDVVVDEVMDLVVTLQRRGVLTDDEATRLYGEHVKEQFEQGQKDQRPIHERLAPTLDAARRNGPYYPCDHKRETDEFWGEDD